MLYNLLGTLTQMNAATNFVAEVMQHTDIPLERLFDRLFRRLQEMITAEILGDVAHLLTAAYPDNDCTTLLHMIARYDEIRIREEGGNRELAFGLLSEQIVQMDCNRNIVIECWKWNFALASRLRSACWTNLEDLYQCAMGAAEKVSAPEQFQCVGEIAYHMAMYCLQIGEKEDEAKTLYIEAGRNRLSYWETLLSQSLYVPRVAMFAIAQKVAMIRGDWVDCFGEGSIDECPVSEALFNQLTANYGDDVLKLSGFIGTQKAEA